MKRLGLNLTVALLCFAVGLLAAATRAFVSPRREGEAVAARVGRASSSANGSIRNVDFLNFTYRGGKGPLRPEAPREFTLDNGWFLDDGHWLIRGWPSGITYADLTGDGEEEAIVKLLGVGEPTGQGQFVYVYTMERGEPRLLWLFQSYGPTVWDTGFISELYADGGDLVMLIRGRNELRPDGATIELTKRCNECLEDYTRALFHWDGERFRKVKLEVYSSHGAGD